MTVSQFFVRTGVVAALVASGLVLAAPNALADPAWTIVPTPDPAQNSAFLQGVSCADATTCIAVGYTGQGPAEQLLTERWNGTAWSKKTAPTPSGTTSAQFTGVSCTSTSACIAVGNFVTASGRLPLAEQWNGTSWNVLATAAPPAGAGGFLGVACSSATACTAVGNQGNPAQTLAERWNGSTWTVQTTQDPSGVFDDEFWGVSCPTGGVCFAVGTDDTNTGGHSIAEVWRNGSWQSVTVPEPSGATQSGLLGVDCGTGTKCQAVGFAIGSPEPGLLAESWNGTALTPESVPGPSGSSTGELAGVSCTSGASCRAVGEAEDANGLSQSLAVVLHSGSWSEQPVTPPHGTFQAGLAAVSCSAASACTAVGDEAPGAAGAVTLAERSAGSSWKPQHTPAASPADETELSGVDCLATSNCVSVGQYSTTTLEPLGQSWDGTRWTFTPASGGPGATSATYAAVSCATNCTAVGTYTDVHGNQRQFSATRSTGPYGFSTVHTLPLQSGATSEGAAAISCTSSTFCIAVGYWLDSSEAEHPLVEKYNGTSWTLQTAAEVSGVQSHLSGVSCVSTTMCLAVGGDTTGNGFAETWNGSSWQLASPPAVVGSTFATFSGVSCRSASACVAVGLTDVNQGVLVASWASGVWTRQTVTLPADSEGGQLFGVSCPTTTCTAVGDSQTESGTVPLAVQGSGASWTGTLLPAPAGSSTALLEGVRCFSTSDCEAVGYSSDEGGVHSALAERLH